MKIIYPEKYNPYPIIKIPNNILKEFLQSNWEHKDKDKKEEIMNLLAEELGTQMGLKMKYSIKVTTLNEGDAAGFGIIDSIKGTYGIIISEEDLKNINEVGARFFNSICHKMKL